MAALKERVLKAMRAVAPAGARVLVAISGGPDSVALTYLLHELQETGAVRLAGLAHFNHQLRGADADADEAFCRTLAGMLGTPFFSERGEVAEASRLTKTSLEDAGRRLRYAFLERARVQAGADVVAVAHTRDDQAETFILRLLRGAGTRGLASMRPRRDAIVRPLLDVGRDELHAWLASLDVPFRIDSSNADLSFPRNRVRHDVLPAMERVTPGAAESIARAARVAADEEDFLENAAIEALPAVVLSDEGGTFRLDRLRLAALHPAVGRRVLRHALARVSGNRFIALRHIEALRGLTSGGLDLPGVSARVEAGLLVLAPAEGSGRARRRAESNVFCYPLSIPGEALVQESGVSISAEIVIGGGETAENPMDGVRLSAAVLEGDGRGGLFVRNRRPGDRLRPFGMTGTRKLQDYLIDRKVPRSERDRVPLVVDSRNRIVWVVGHTVAEDYRVTDPKGAVLLLKVRYLGERFELDS